MSSSWERQDFYIALTVSLMMHLALACLLIYRPAAQDKTLKPIVVYSVSIEGGKKLGGISQVAKQKKKTPVAPPKNVKKAKAEAVKVEKKTKKTEKPKEKKSTEDKKAEVSLAKEKKKEDKKKVVKKEEKTSKPIPKQKKVTKPKIKTKPKTGKTNIDAKLQDAVQRYLGESSDGGGQGFGAARLGGNAMGGGVVRPPEFFEYRDVLMEHLKSGWKWPNTSVALVAQVELNIEANGVIKKAVLAVSSGNTEFDKSVIRAVKKASPVPIPPERVYRYFELVRVTFDPRD